MLISIENPRPERDGFRRKGISGRHFRLAGVLAVCVFAFACGYRFAGSGDLPDSITSVGVRTFDNRTAEIGLENLLTNDMAFELTRSGRVPVKRPEAAAVVMSGTIRSLRVTNLSRRGSNVAQEQRVTLSVEFVAIDQDGETLWKRLLTDSEEYFVASDNFATRANRRAALESLSSRLAEKAYYGLTDRF